MDNELIMEIKDETTQNKLANRKIGLGVGVLLVIILLMIIFSILGSPKILMGILLSNTQDTVNDFFAMEEVELPLYLRESFQRETLIYTNDLDEFLGLSEDMKVQIEVKSGYINETGDFLSEIDFGVGDLDIITGGIYFEENDIAIISTLLVDKYVINCDEADDMGNNTTLNERLELLGASKNDAKLRELEESLKIKLEEYRKFAIKKIPREALSKGKSTIELIGKDKKTKYVMIEMDQDIFEDLAEEVLDRAADDDELETLINDIIAYCNEEDVMDEEIEEIDLANECDDLLDEIEDYEFDDMFIKIFYEGFTPISYQFEFDDGNDETEIYAQLYKAGSNKQIYINVESYDTDFEFDYISGKKISTLECEFEIDGYIVGEVEGEMEKNRNETIFEFDCKYAEDDYSDYEVKIDGSIEVDGKITTTEFDFDLKEYYFGQEEIEMKVECVTEEIKANKEYSSECDIEISLPMIDISGEVKAETTTIYGSKAEVDLPSWSINDVHAKASDEEELIELFVALYEDFSAGISDVFAMIFFGSLY